MANTRLHRLYTDQCDGRGQRDDRRQQPKEAGQLPQALPVLQHARSSSSRPAPSPADLETQHGAGQVPGQPGSTAPGRKYPGTMVGTDDREGLRVADRWATCKAKTAQKRAQPAQPPDDHQLAETAAPARHSNDRPAGHGQIGMKPTKDL
eukprot:scaffold2270_cov24-Prasinocladus_malaysianus.AAC.1